MANKKLTILLAEEDIDRLRMMAQDGGYVSTTGPLAGQGNITKLIEAIARGSVVIVYGLDANLELERRLQVIRQQRAAAEESARAAQHAYEEWDRLRRENEAELERLDKMGETLQAIAELGRLMGRELGSGALDEVLRQIIADHPDSVEIQGGPGQT